MSMLSDIKTLLSPLNVPIETGAFSGLAPDEYIVITPMDEQFEEFADNKPLIDIGEVRISIFSKGNYQRLKYLITAAFIEADYTITQRQYIGYEADTGYHHFVIDVAQYYETEE